MFPVVNLPDRLQNQGTAHQLQRDHLRKKGDIKKFSEVITKDAKTDEGLFNVHKVDDKYYFEIPNELLEREMLLVSRVAGSVQNLSFGGAGQKLVDNK